MKSKMVETHREYTERVLGFPLDKYPGFNIYYSSEGPTMVLRDQQHDVFVFEGALIEKFLNALDAIVKGYHD